MVDELFPILTTPDLARSLAFYRDLLGGEMTYRFPPDGEPAFVSLRLGRSTLGLGRQDEPGDLANDRITLWLYTDDCDATLDKLRAGGVRVVQEPVDQPWGERMATVLDPDGNPVILANRAATES